MDITSQYEILDNCNYSILVRKSEGKLKLLHRSHLSLTLYMAIFSLSSTLVTRISPVLWSTTNTWKGCWLAPGPARE